jgi:hypothetical protein
MCGSRWIEGSNTHEKSIDESFSHLIPGEVQFRPPSGSRGVYRPWDGFDPVKYHEFQNITTWQSGGRGAGRRWLVVDAQHGRATPGCCNILELRLNGEMI